MVKVELYKCDDCGDRIEVAAGPGKLRRWVQRTYQEPSVVIDLCIECYGRRITEWKEAKHVLANGGPVSPDDDLLLTRAAYEFIGRYVLKEGKKK